MSDFYDAERRTPKGNDEGRTKTGTGMAKRRFDEGEVFELEERKR